MVSEFNYETCHYIKLTHGGLSDQFKANIETIFGQFRKFQGTAKLENDVQVEFYSRPNLGAPSTQGFKVFFKVRVGSKPRLGVTVGGDVLGAWCNIFPFHYRDIPVSEAEAESIREVFRGVLSQFSARIPQNTEPD